MSEAWERFNQLRQSCPHHNFSDWMLVDAFYDGLSPQVRVMVDYAAGGSIVDRAPSEILELIEKLAQQQQWSNRDSVRSTKERYEVDQLSLIQAKLEALTLKLEKSEAPKVVQETSCALCGEAHAYDHCPLP